jgi:hypothetical protein
MPKQDTPVATNEIVRIVLPVEDAERLRRAGKRRGLSLSAFGRMLLLEALSTDGGGGVRDNK